MASLSGKELYIRARRALKNDRLVLLFLSIFVGAISAYGAIAFRETARLVQSIGFGTASESLYMDVAMLPWWQIVLVPTAGGLLIGLFVQYVMPGGRPQAVADVIEASAMRSGRMSGKVGLGAAAISAASIGVGASVGREGPVVHLGATLASFTAGRLGLGKSQTVTLLGCGIAAAISSSFNAPLAGVLFAHEVVIGHYALTAFAPIVIAAVIGTMISRLQYGDYPAFILPDHTIASFLELPAFALLGVACAVAAIALMRSVALSSLIAARVPLPQWAKPAVAGLIVGAIALVFPHVLGVGYGATDAALKGQLAFGLLLTLIVVKTAATAICLGAGFGGGIFSPSLYIGAMVGGAFGVLATDISPALSSGPTAYTLVGMGAVAGAVLGAPISTILIVFEMTADYALTIGVMVAVVIASTIVQQAGIQSFFIWQLDRRGLNLRGGREHGLLRSLLVGDVMKREFSAVPMSVDMDKVRHALQTAPHAELFVLQGGDKLYGTITLGDLSEAAFDTSADAILNAGDVARTHPPVLSADADLSTALQLMDSSGEEHIGVVDDKEHMRLIGFVHQKDVITAYNRAILDARREERGEF